jgi:prepilin-type N-terminal cleavage/methylation domain-containing protein
MNQKSLAKQIGMTLLEVLVATTILTILSALAFVSIDNMVNAKALIKLHTDQLNQDTLGFYQIQNDLQFAVSDRQLNIINPEFIGSSQGFSLLRYQSPAATSSRIEQSQVTVFNSLKRVKWYLKGQHLIRASQSAYGIDNGVNWQERSYYIVNTATRQELKQVNGLTAQ